MKATSRIVALATKSRNGWAFCEINHSFLLKSLSSAVPRPARKLPFRASFRPSSRAPSVPSERPFARKRPFRYIASLPSFICATRDNIREIALLGIFAKRRSQFSSSKRGVVELCTMLGSSTISHARRQSFCPFGLERGPECANPSSSRRRRNFSRQN